MSGLTFRGLTLVGLGPGLADLLTRQAGDWLENLSLVYTPAPDHPALAGLPASVRVAAVDAARTADLESLESAYYLGSLLDQAESTGGLTLAVPGHPLEMNPIAEKLYDLAQARQVNVQVLPGLGWADYARTALGVHPHGSLSLVDAAALARQLVPAFPPSVPVLVCAISGVDQIRKLAETLTSLYPASHAAKLVEVTRAGPLVQDVTLGQLQARPGAFRGGCLYVPPLEQGSSFEDFQEVIARLRAPDGCPWDREQTHLTLRRHLLEETYEALEALDNQDPAKMAEEFGDLLLQIVLHAQIASESREFSMLDIVKGIHHKIVRRHPHVFGDVEVGGVQGVLLNWEKLKAAERTASGDETRGILDGVPPALPALTQAQEIQERAARVGFDWPEISGVLEKVGEEIGEIHLAESEDELAWELGDLLFAVVNVARWKKVDAETALRDASKRFRQRFAYIEHAARQRGVAVSELGFEEMDRLWEAAKKE